MKSGIDLKNELQRMDHRGYPAYKDLRGAWRMRDFVFVIDHVQGDPFASPSSVHVEVEGKTAGFPKEYFAQKHRRIALEDHLVRLFSAETSHHSRHAGSGKSGAIECSRPGQEILERTACHVDSASGKVTFRFRMGFPARGRSIDARAMIRLVFEDIPEMVARSLIFRNIDQRVLKKVIELADDQLALRNFIKEENLVAFLADGSVLPRKSGVSQLPMANAVAFSSPESLRVDVTLPHRGKISGMGLKHGITLIVGGGYHGKSTVLSALMLGVYDHIGGDGRELVVTDPTAMKVRAEDGRSVKKDDISMFIHDLPNGADSTVFSTENASGSTSQAAGIVEAMEAGTKTLLIDEDTSATNLMMRDELMEKAVPSDGEPITPLIDRIADIRDQMGISTVLVAGSFGAYFGVADTVLRLDHYHVQDITETAKELAEQYGIKRPKVAWSGTPSFERVAKKSRVFSEPRLKMKTMGVEGFSVDHEQIDLRLVEQLADSEQTSALAACLKYLELHVFDGKRTVSEAVTELGKLLNEKGLTVVCAGAQAIPSLAMPRTQEILAAVNRYRGLEV